jgi:hypothetical protein
MNLVASSQFVAFAGGEHQVQQPRKCKCSTKGLEGATLTVWVEEVVNKVLNHFDRTIQIFKGLSLEQLQ